MLLRTLLTSFIALLAALSSSQIADTDSSDRLAKRVVEVFNKGDGKALEAMATADFLGSIPPGALSQLVFGVRTMGTLGEPELILDIGEQRHYKIAIKQSGKPDRFFLLVLGAESAEKFFSFGAAPYRQPIERAKPFATDNKRKSILDLAVQGAVDRYIGQNNPVGMSIGVLKDGKESFYNYGVANPQKGATADENTVYEIGSITKSMTGILLAKAVQDGRLSLDDDIRKYLPGSYPNLEFEGTPIRIRDLATHSSGLPANPPGIPDNAGAEGYESYSREKLLADLTQIKLTKKPGMAFSYSNMGAGLCGPILEKVYGASYDRQLQKYIFDPAKMTDSSTRLKGTMDRRFATPYDPKGNKTDRWTVNGIEAAGAVRSTARDMLRYAKLNLDSANPAVALAHQQLSTTGTTPMGIFWQIGSSRTGGPYVTHEGGTGGFTANLLVFPREKLAVVVLMNTGEQQAGQLGYETALRYLNALSQGAK